MKIGYFLLPHRLLGQKRDEFGMPYISTGTVALQRLLYGSPPFPALHSSFTDVWTSGRLVIRMSGRLAVWSSNRLDVWTSRRLDGGTLGRMSIWTSGYLSICLVSRMLEYPTRWMAGWLYGRIAVSEHESRMA
jgi:hypothetical protein